MNEINVAIIGCGGIASVHAERLIKIEGVRLKAFVDIDEKRAKSFSEKFGGHYYNSIDQLVKNEHIDALFITTPPFARGDEVKAIEKGIAVFFEKPVALNMRKAEEILDSIRRYSVINSVGYMWRYLDISSVAKEEVVKNSPTAMVLGQYIDPFWFPPKHWWLYKDKGGGQVVEQATHVFDLARYLEGEVSRVYAEIDNRIAGKFIYSDMTAEDSSIVSLRFKTGAVGVIVSSCVSQNTFTGTLLRLITRNIVVEHLGHSKILRIYEKNRIQEFRSPVDPYFEEDKVFIEAVKTGDTSKIKSSFEDAVKTLKITLAANESAKTGKAISLE
ncbi:MAG: Gfo/Idh/MocA family oxidoreductase [Thaumarchaeota archaeon]|jgi:predicted dehydrogenase|nr:Gfo/Idh/MocA family oxidoreductase [Nitrososphaerota archaeon]